MSDDELAGMDNWIEVSPEVEDAARRLRELYLGLLTTGFTELQAMTIIGHAIAGRTSS